MENYRTSPGGVPAAIKQGMCDERERYLTFLHRNWPTEAPVSASKLAKAGFFYIGINDTVQCFSCTGRINEWEHGDTAMGEHKRLYPKCKFVIGTDHRNVPYKGLVDESQNASARESSAELRALSPSSRNKVSDPEDIVGLLKTFKELKVSEPSTEPLECFKQEINRLLSFRTWPSSSPVDRYDLAAAGFYCLKETTVQCFACLVRVSKWRLGDKPIYKHKRVSPACPFISGHHTENRPLSTAEKDEAIKYFEVKVAEQIGTGAFSPSVSSFSRVNLSKFVNGKKTQPANQQTNLIVRHAKYPDLANEEARLATYHHWPRGHCQIPVNLARAGFFATLNDDEVKCFYCGGGLKGWEEGDDPWEEHARWFTRCEWLLQQRGPGFIAIVRRKFHQAPYEPNMGTPADQNTPRLPSPFSQNFPPSKRGDQTLLSATARTKAAMVRQDSFKEDGERSKTETKKQRPRKRMGKKKQTKNTNTKSLEDRVEEAFQSDTAQLMIALGQDEEMIRTVIRKRLQKGQRSYESSEDILTAIFEEEASQKTDAGTSGQPGSLQSDAGPQGRGAGRMDDRKDGNEINMLSEELEKQRAKLLCKICLDNDVEILFLPCKHLVTCKNCASQLHNCPICRKVVDDKLLTYIS